MSLLACFIRFFTGVQANWFGCKPDNRQRIYFANHTSHFDFFVLWSVLPRQLRRNICPAGASDYWLKGRLRCWIAERIFKMIPVEREHITRENNPIGKITAVLDTGKSIIIFPEGGRNSDSQLKEFKVGLYHLAKARPNIDLIPVYIDNANRVLPKGECLPVPLICSIVFGKSLKLQANENKRDFLDRAQWAVKECAHK